MRCSCGRLAEEPPWRACRKGRRPHFVNSPASIFIIHNACPAHLQQLACPAAAGAPPSGRPPAISASLRRSRASEKSCIIIWNTYNRADGAASALSHSGGAAAVCPLRARRGPSASLCRVYTHLLQHQRLGLRDAVKGTWLTGIKAAHAVIDNATGGSERPQCRPLRPVPIQQGLLAVTQSAGVWGAV